MKKWTTKEGKEIAYNKIEDGHLLNILKFIEKKAKDGIEIIEGGIDWEDGMPYGDSYYIEGDRVLAIYDYNSLLEEAKKRKIL